MAEPSPKTSSNTDTLIGRVINDRFEIIDLIARGGMGRVYRAQQRPLGRQVALKILDPRYKGDEDPEFQTRFFLEASTAAKLSHPNTVTVFDYGKTTDEIYFIVMELVEGRTLSALLKELGPIEPERAINIAVQIARSVREAHGMGVIHRDLKPANVLLTRHGDEEDFVKVLDFGLVKDVEANEELTQAGLFMGSPKYMSPEQIQGGDVDARTDIYALGVMLYLMLCGRVPFDRDNQVQILMAHMREAVPPMVRDDGVAVPPALEAVVMNCLEKDANNRYSDMNELVAALKSASGQMGSPLNTSGNYALSGAFDLSGMRATPGITPNGTPGHGFPSSSPSNGFAAASGSLPGLERDLDAEDQKGGSGKWIALLLVLALGGGAAAAVLSSTCPHWRGDGPGTRAAARSPHDAPRGGRAARGHSRPHRERESVWRGSAAGQRRGRPALGSPRGHRPARQPSARRDAHPARAGRRRCRPRSRADLHLPEGRLRRAELRAGGHRRAQHARGGHHAAHAGHPSAHPDHRDG